MPDLPTEISNVVGGIVRSTIFTMLDDLARYGIRPLTPASWVQYGEHLEEYLLPGATEISAGIRNGDGPAEYLSLLTDQQGLRALLAEKMAERAEVALRRSTVKVELKRFDDDAVVGMHEHDIRATSGPAAIMEALRRSYEAVSRGVKFEVWVRASNSGASSLVHRYGAPEIHY